MSLLLDTSVVSEWVKRCPDPGVVAWLEKVNEDRVFLERRDAGLRIKRSPP